MVNTEARILFVDDERKFAETVSHFLEEHGLEVHVAFSGSDALQIYKEQEFDILVTDLKMPVMDGIELIRHVRQRDPRQRIIVITGFLSQLMPWNTRLSPSQSMEDRFDIGTIDYLIKPFRPERLLDVIQKVLTREDHDTGKPRSILDSHPAASGLLCEDLVLMSGLDSRSTVIEARKNGNVGFIYMSRGEVVHARTPSQTGEEAFFEIILWETNDIATKPYEGDIDFTINRNVAALLLKAARLKEKKSVSHPDAPGEAKNTGSGSHE